MCSKGIHFLLNSSNYRRVVLNSSSPPMPCQGKEWLQGSGSSLVLCLPSSFPCSLPAPSPLPFAPPPPQSLPLLLCSPHSVTGQDGHELLLVSLYLLSARHCSV